MKRFLLFSFIFLACGAVCFGQDGNKINKEEREIRASVKGWADAIVSRDMKALDKLFSEDLFITAFDGSTRGKKEELEALKPSPGVKTLSVENEELTIGIYNGSAIVTAIVKMRFEIGGKEMQTAFRYTAVFIKKDGRRQIAVLQTTRIARIAQGTQPAQAAQRETGT